MFLVVNDLAENTTKIADFNVENSLADVILFDF